MPSRCNIEIYRKKGPNGDKPLREVVLYHDMDGNPAFMGPKILRFMEYIWNEKGITGTQLIAAHMVTLSCGFYDKPTELQDIDKLGPDERDRISFRSGRPCFKYTDMSTADSDYLWRIIIDNKGYTIVCLAMFSSIPEVIDWQEACISQIKRWIMPMYDNLRDAEMQGDGDSVKNYKAAIETTNKEIEELKELFDKHRDKVGGLK